MKKEKIGYYSTIYLLISISVILAICIVILAIVLNNIVILTFLIAPCIPVLIMLALKKYLFSFIEISDRGIGRKYKNQTLCYFSWDKIIEVKSIIIREIVFVGEGQCIDEIYKNPFANIVITTTITNSKKLSKFQNCYKDKITNIDLIPKDSQNFILGK